jgi:hypothetical protein
MRFEALGWRFEAIKLIAESSPVKCASLIFYENIYLGRQREKIEDK